MKRLILLLMFVLVLTLSACGKESPPTDSHFVAPIIYGVEDEEFYIGDTQWDSTDNIIASDEIYGDITQDIVVEGFVDINTPGEYILTYTVTNAEGRTVSVSRTITILDIEASYPTSFFNYKFADATLRLNFMAAAEKYLMGGMIGGIPIYANSDSVVFSNRMILPYEEYLPILEFNNRMMTFNQDDSSVLMEDSNFGDADDFTFRSTSQANPYTYNHWLYDTYTDENYMELYVGALYDFETNADESGFELNPFMASELPVGIDSEFTDYGVEVSQVWDINLRDDLIWKFHPDTDSGFIDTNPDEVINAYDFVDTYKLVLDEMWFRAISGGGDFICSSQTIKGAQDYVDGIGTFEDVGLTAIDEDTIRIEFVPEMTQFNVTYFLSSFGMTPINLELYEYYQSSLAPGEQNPYGTSPETIAYSGEYYIEEVVANDYVKMKANDKFYYQDYSMITGQLIYILDDEVPFDLFVEGLIDISDIPFDQYDNSVLETSIVKETPGATTYKLNINGLKTVEAQREQFPGETWIPEPLLGHNDFKLAMFYAMDRNTLTNEIIPSRSNSMLYFNDLYLIDLESGIPYRRTPQGLDVATDYSPETWGFDLDQSRELFISAVSDLIDEGHYEAGTLENPTIITIELNNFAESETWDLTCEYIKSVFEETFIDDVNHVQVRIDIKTRDFPAIYYDHMMIGEFDLSVGGISGNIFDAGSYLDIYCSDNRSGFTLNFGIDTSIAEIPIRYYDVEGIYRHEIWSYDAIASVLNGEVFIYEGAEAKQPEVNIIEKTNSTIEFEVIDFNELIYSNLTYTLEYWNWDDWYTPLEGFIDIPINSDIILIENLDHYLYLIDEFGEVIYQGDYRIILNYGYIEDETESGSTYSISIYTEELLEIVTDTFTETSAVYNFNINNDDNPTREISSIELYEKQIDETYLLKEDAVIDFSNLLLASISGLNSDTNYVVKVIFNDGEITYLNFSTEIEPLI